ncbi:MAG: hypothetical protein HOP13_15125 [Alphaproteobacteria bacterium]|nr:hypothetical protein [Alphaproteobacteria bacterium]
MTHVIATFIAKRRPAAALSRAMGDAAVHKLNHPELLLVPVSDDAFDAVVAREGPSDSVGPEFWRLTETLMELARECSVHGPIAYAETDYFGGVGVQSAAAWIQGKLALPPTTHPAGPINAALHTIGLERANGLDEFDTLGLGLVRRMDVFEERTPESLETTP